MVRTGLHRAARLGSGGVSGSSGNFPGELAQLCGRSPELIAGIIAGEMPVDAATAAEFERVLGLAAHIWLGIEERYRQGLALGQRVAGLERETAA